MDRRADLFNIIFHNFKQICTVYSLIPDDCLGLLAKVNSSVLNLILLIRSPFSPPSQQVRYH